MEKQIKSPIIVVGRKTFNKNITALRYDMPLRKALKLFPNAQWQPVSEDRIILLDKPEQVIFKKRFVNDVYTKTVRLIECSREDRFFERLTFYFK